MQIQKGKSHTLHAIITIAVIAFTILAVTILLVTLQKRKEAAEKQKNLDPRYNLSGKINPPPASFPEDQIKPEGKLLPPATFNEEPEISNK